MECAARNELRRVRHLFDDTTKLAKIMFIRLFRDKLCTDVQALPIVRRVLTAEGYDANDVVLEHLCYTVAGTFL